MAELASTVNMAAHPFLAFTKTDRFHFESRSDPLASLYANAQGYWVLMYDGQCLYKSKGRGHDDPPPRRWRCIEGSLPPPGVSTVDLPEDSRPMVVLDESKRPKVPPIDVRSTQSSVALMPSPSTPSTNRMSTVKAMETLRGRSPSSSHHGVSSKSKKKRKKKVFF